MSASPTFSRGDEPTRTTRLALDVIDVRRVQKRMKAIYAAGVLVGALLAAGYALHDRVDHFATVEKVAGHDERLDRLERQVGEYNARMLDLIDTQKRTLDGVDEVKRILMTRAGRHGDR